MVSLRNQHIMHPKIRVLIIAHNYNAATLLGRFLLINGFLVELIANSYELAVDLMNFDRPDIVLIEMDMLGEESVCHKITNLIDTFFHLPMIFMSSNQQQLNCFKPRYNRTVIPVLKENLHYHSHVLVAIENLIRPLVSLNSQLIETNAVINPILVNDEPKHLKSNELKYSKLMIDTFNIAFMEANNTDNRNTSLLWLHHNHEYCLQVSISLIKLVLRHNGIRFIRISNKIFINPLMIESYKVHYSVTIDNHELMIGRHFKKR